MICGRYLLISLSITSWHFSNFPELLLHRSPLAVIHWEVRTFNQTVDILLANSFFRVWKDEKMMMQFLNLPFLANFSKLTGMSQTYHLMTNLLVCNIFYLILCNFFCHLIILFFLIFFTNIFVGKSCRLFFLSIL